VSVVTACETFTAMTDTDIKSHKIEFPCNDYPIKVIGDTSVGFTAAVMEVLKKHATVDLKTLA